MAQDRACAAMATVLPARRDAVRLSAARGKLWADRPQSLGALNVSASGMK